MNDFSIEFVLSIEKIINDNGCWIPKFLTSRSNGYSNIRIGGKLLKLSRVVMCLYNNINYYEPKVEARHNTGCDRACFNPEHLKPGTGSENSFDAIEAGTHTQSRKENCPRCGSVFKKFKTRRDGKIVWRRVCRYCKSISTAESKLRAKVSSPLSE